MNFNPWFLDVPGSKLFPPSKITNKTKQKKNKLVMNKIKNKNQTQQQ